MSARTSHERPENAPIRKAIADMEFEEENTPGADCMVIPHFSNMKIRDERTVRLPFFSTFLKN